MLAEEVFGVSEGWDVAGAAGTRSGGEAVLLLAVLEVVSMPAMCAVP